MDNPIGLTWESKSDLHNYYRQESGSEDQFGTTQDQFEMYEPLDVENDQSEIDELATDLKEGDARGELKLFQLQRRKPTTFLSV